MTADTTKGRGVLYALIAALALWNAWLTWKLASHSTDIDMALSVAGRAMERAHLAKTLAEENRR